MKKNTNRKKKKKTGLVIAASVFGVLTVLIVAVCIIIISYINKVNYVPLVENYTVLASIPPDTETDMEGYEEISSADSSEEELNAYQSAAKAALKDLGLEDVKLNDVYNVLLIGSDTRTQNGVGRSDTMMLLSINRNSHEIVLTSFLRDLYVYIPQRDVYDKLNSAYSYGGVELLLETLRYNFSIAVDRYVSVDFYSFVDVIDILGGVDIDVEEYELGWVNKYIIENNKLLGEELYDGQLSFADGTYQHLNGKQALAYSRIRYVGNGDFTRTARQRNVINQIFDKVKSIDVNTLFELLDTILPQLTTNIEKNEMIELIAMIPELSRYEIISWGLPDEAFQYLTIEGKSCVGIDFKFYIEKLYYLIYGYENEE